MRELHGWRMWAPRSLERFEAPAGPLPTGNVLVEVAGCGVCHTDIDYLFHGVPTKKAPPLVLGHEIAGVIVDGADDVRGRLGERVVVAAVWPCGTCPACRGGRPTSCARSRMPGNDVDGGQASHVVVPAAMAFSVDAPGERPAAGAPVGAAGLALWELAVVADAVTTPLEAVRRAGVAPGDLAIVIGVGGVGAYGVQIARLAGATVVAVDVSSERLRLADALGAAVTLPALDGAKAIRAVLRQLATEGRIPADGWRVFEMSGTRAGQELAWGLLTRGGSLSVVGFTVETSTLRLSQLMALDASAHGNWGADPARYPEAIAMAAAGTLKVRPLVRREPLDDLVRVLAAVENHELRERVVLVP